MPLFKFLLAITMAFTTGNDNIPAPVATTDQAADNQQTLFSYIRAHRQAKNVVINWGTSSISTIDHFEVYYSEVGDLFDRIATVDLDGTMKYTYTHESLYPGYHYYYIRAIMNNGSAPVDSPVDVVRIVGR